MRFNNLQDWLTWLESCHPAEIDLGLERVGRVANTMGLDLATPKVVTIAGTNGKGSCVASLNALLLSAGYRVGCFTSPHFLKYNERIVVDNVPVSDQKIVAAFDLIDQARGDISLSYFEFGTLAALIVFQQSHLDVVLLEVGLGGRLDAVNIIDADVTVVTSIAIDHEAWLGDDREIIGREKAGIFRAGQKAISAGLNPPKSLQQVANECGTSLLQAGIDFTLDAEQGRWCGKGQEANDIVLSGLQLPSLPLESVSAAIQTLQLLELPLKAIDYNCLATLSLPGRYQSLIIEGKQVILDVAHNPAAAEHLSQRLTDHPCAGQSFALLAVMKDKDITGMVSALSAHVDHWFLADIKETPKLMPAKLLAKQLVQQGCHKVSVNQNVREALQTALSLMSDEDRLIVVGSFITVAAVLALQSSKNIL